MASFDREINNCLSVLQKGGTFLYPTDTVWGLGCDATNPVAVEKIFHLKNRPENKNLIILIDRAEKIQHYVSIIPENAGDLIKNAGAPLTIIYPHAKNLAANVIANDGSVAIRIVADDFCRKLILAFGKPIVSTSANISGESTPVFFKDIAHEIVDNVDYVVDESLAQFHKLKPSQIIKLETNGEFRVIRK